MPDPMNTKITTNHNFIEGWVEERGGKPAVDVERSNDKIVLAIDFDKKAKENLKHVSWDEFFEDFDDERMAFLFQEEKLDGGISKYYRLINR
jgi:hypothetical protein